MVHMQIDHPVFRDFKQRPARYDLTICFPAGAGGNFLAQALLSQQPQGSALNEFTAAAAKAAQNLRYDERMKLDSVPLWRLANISDGSCVAKPTLQPHLDGLYALLASGYKLPVLSEPRIMLSHYPVWFSAEILDYQTQELFYIEPCDQSQLLIKGLDTVKGLTGSDWPTKPSAIAWLLNWQRRNPSADNGVFSTSEFNTGRYDICNELGLDLDHFNLLLWSYYVQCKHQRSRMTTVGFRDHMSQLLADDMADWSNQAYKLTKDAVAVRSQRQFSVSYAELFFDLRIPRDSLLSEIDRAVILRYSRQNLQLLEQLLCMLADAAADRLRNTLLALAQRLAAAEQLLLQGCINGI